MNVQLPPPANWQDFENLCYHLWKSIWGDTSAHKNGRSGQQQHGVDVYGRPFSSRKYHGVQCKGKTTIYGSVLTCKELENEAENAENFQPALEKFTMATTSPSDVSVQTKCRQINASRIRSFDVDVWSWDDISLEVQCRPEVYNSFYKDFPLDMISVDEMHLGNLDMNDKIIAFLTRPNILEDFSMSVVETLQKIAEHNA